MKSRQDAGATKMREILRWPRKKSRTKRVRVGNLRMTARSRFLVVRPCRTMGGLPRNNIVWSEPEAARWGKTRGLVSAIGARFELLRQLRRKKSRFRHSFLDKVCECIY